jgi:IMP dehydrogenase
MSLLSPNEYLSYDDVLLLPCKGIVPSRSSVDLKTDLTALISMKLPIVSAPMSSVTEGRMAKGMYDAGGFGFIHRFMTICQQIEEFKLTGERSGIALGVNEGYDRVIQLHQAGARIFCVDIAHGHSVAMENYLTGLWDIFSPNTIHVIAGNVATRAGVQFLLDLNVDAIKVGIGPGAACSTREVTGFGVPQFTAVREAAEHISSQIKYDRLAKFVPIIADGGIKNSGDMAKALAAGASSVMLGRLLAGADEVPEPGTYYGQASKRVNGHHAPEGVEGTVTTTGPVKNVLKQLEWGLRSAVSYGGADNLNDFRCNATFIRISPMTSYESATRL